MDGSSIVKIELIVTHVYIYIYIRTIHYQIVKRMQSLWTVRYDASHSIAMTL